MKYKVTLYYPSIIGKSAFDENHKVEFIEADILKSEDRIHTFGNYIDQVNNHTNPNNINIVAIYPVNLTVIEPIYK